MGAHGELSEKKRVFVEAYMANGGNALRAAETAGLGKTYNAHGATGSKALRDPLVIAALKERAENDPLVSTRVERQRWWTAIMRDSEMEIGSRLRASELLAKSQGDFTVKIEGKIEVEHVDIRAELSGMLDEIANRSAQVSAQPAN